MKTQRNRLTRLEQKTPPNKRQFIGWLQDPWTAEQQKEAIRREPHRRIFWRSLLDGPANQPAPKRCCPKRRDP